MSVGIALLVLVLGIWGGWKYSQNERINQANLYHLARAKLNNPILSPEERVFPDFSLSRLLNSVFDPIAGSSICILTDFEDPKTEMLNYHFLEKEA